jgi:hypothetical protein
MEAESLKENLMEPTDYKSTNNPTADPATRRDVLHRAFQRVAEAVQDVEGHLTRVDFKEDEAEGLEKLKSHLHAALNWLNQESGKLAETPFVSTEVQTQPAPQVQEEVKSKTAPANESEVQTDTKASEATPEAKEDEAASNTSSQE